MNTPSTPVQTSGILSPNDKNYIQPSPRNIDAPLMFGQLGVSRNIINNPGIN